MNTKDIKSQFYDLYRLAIDAFVKENNFPIIDIDGDIRKNLRGEFDKAQIGNLIDDIITPSNWSFDINIISTYQDPEINLNNYVYPASVLVGLFNPSVHLNDSVCDVKEHLVSYISSIITLKFETYGYWKNSDDELFTRKWFQPSKELISKLIDLLSPELVKCHNELISSFNKIESVIADKYLKLKTDNLNSFSEDISKACDTLLQTLGGHIEDDELISLVNRICNKSIAKHGMKAFS
jgi:hypothetical protein